LDQNTQKATPPGFEPNCVFWGGSKHSKSDAAGI
jgi:hypothetical protein